MRVGASSQGGGAGVGPHPRSEAPSGRSQGRGAGRGDGPAAGPYQQLSFRTLCSSEALARDRTIFRVSFMVAGRGDPDPGRALDPPATGRISAPRWRVSRGRGPRRQGRVLQAHWPPGEGAGRRERSGAAWPALPPWLRPLPPRGPSVVLRLRGVGSPGCDVTLRRPEKATVPCPESHPRVLSSSSSLDLRARGAEFPPRLLAPSFRAPAPALEATLSRLPRVAALRPETGQPGRSWGRVAPLAPFLPAFKEMRQVPQTRGAALAEPSQVLKPFRNRRSPGLRVTLRQAFGIWMG